MATSRLAKLVAAALLALALLVSAGCGRARRVSPAAPLQPAASAPASSSASPTATPLQPAEAQALDAELSALDKELDGLSLPDDSDFSDIEQGLR